MIDLHCHILPGVDDGAGSIEESLAMARIAVQDGIHTIVATPHALNGVYQNSVRETTKKVADLQETFTQDNIALTLYPGADTHLCPHMQELIASGQAGTIDNNGKYILLELPFQSIPTGVKGEIFNLKLNNITPIITHPERNPAIQQDVEILSEFVRMGALSQVTAMSITGDFGGMAQTCSEILLNRRLVHVIASDAHSPDRRPPVLSGAVEAAAKILGSLKEAESMVTDVPASIISGAVVDVSEPIPEKKAHGFWKMHRT